jgi:hypothetical protein
MRRLMVRAPSRVRSKRPSAVSVSWIRHSGLDGSAPSVGNDEEHSEHFLLLLAMSTKHLTMFYGPRCFGGGAV